MTESSDDGGVPVSNQCSAAEGTTDGRILVAVHQEVQRYLDVEGRKIKGIVVFIATVVSVLLAGFGIGAMNLVPALWDETIAKAVATPAADSAREAARTHIEELREAVVSEARYIAYEEGRKVSDLAAMRSADTATQVAEAVARRHVEQLALEKIVEKLTAGDSSFFSTVVQSSQFSNAIGAEAARSEVPAGTVVAFAGGATEAPSGWLFCEGQLVTPDTVNGVPHSSGELGVYKRLYDALAGTHWAASNATTARSLPDLRGVFLRGAHGDLQGAIEMRDPGGRTPRGFEVGTSQSSALRLFNRDQDFSKQMVVQVPPSKQVGVIGTLANGGLTMRVGTLDLWSEISGPENRPANVAVAYLIRY